MERLLLQRIDEWQRDEKALHDKRTELAALQQQTDAIEQQLCDARLTKDTADALRGRITRLESRLADYTEDAGIGRGAIDVPFLLLTLLLLAIGVIMVLSASFARAYYSAASNHNANYYFSRQLLFALAGVAVMLVASRFPIGFYRRISGLVLLGSVALLLLVLVAGTKVNGARRWFEMFGVTFQPSEFA